MDEMVHQPILDENAAAAQGNGALNEYPQQEVQQPQRIEEEKIFHPQEELVSDSDDDDNNLSEQSACSFDAADFEESPVAPVKSSTEKITQNQKKARKLFDKARLKLDPK